MTSNTPSTPDAREIARGLTKAQREAITACDTVNVDRASYEPFRGRAKGLFQIAPGWQRLEIAPLGLSVRAILMEGGDAE